MRLHCLCGRLAAAWSVALAACGGPNRGERTSASRAPDTPRTGAPTLEVSYDGSGAYADRSLVRIVVGERPVLRRLLGRDFTTAVYGTPHSGRFEVPSRGTLPVHVALVTTAGDTLAAARVVLQLEPDYRFGLGLVTGRERPIGPCAGSALAVPIRGPAAHRAVDTLFIMQAALPNGAIC
jgi:hypothetical protein